MKRIYGTQNVLDAARQRIKNIFANGVPVYLSFSSGKDSLCLSHLTYDLILRGEIDAKQLTVIFIDEEGLYKSMLEAALRWREKFLRVGAKFEWYCLEVKQVCVIDKLSATESWITWDKSKRDLWMREPPPFAITEHPLLHYPGEMNYQTFCIRRTADGISSAIESFAYHQKRKPPASSRPRNSPARTNESYRQRILAGGKTVQEIGKQLGMKPEEIFRLSGFTREEFLNLMTDGVEGYSRAVIYKNVR